MTDEQQHHRQQEHQQHHDAATPTAPTDELSQLAELFTDRNVGELAIILASNDNSVQDAAWAILNGETVDDVRGADSFGELNGGREEKVSAGDGNDGKYDDDGDDDLLQGFPRSSPPPARASGPLAPTDGNANGAGEAPPQQKRKSTTKPGAGGDKRKLDGSRLRSLGSKLQNLNLGRLIDQLEQDQAVADQLDFINQENEEELERKRLVREAEQKCMDAMVEHLDEFVRTYPRCTYESWIEELHPENVHEGRLLSGVGSKEVDHRFYVEESDHRRLWNQSLSEMNDGDRRSYVTARTTAPVPGRRMMDLLGDTTENGEADGKGGMEALSTEMATPAILGEAAVDLLQGAKGSETLSTEMATPAILGEAAVDLLQGAKGSEARSTEMATPAILGEAAIDLLGGNVYSISNEGEYDGNASTIDSSDDNIVQDAANGIGIIGGALEETPPSIPTPTSSGDEEEEDMLAPPFAIIDGVVNDSPAKSAGLQEGDLVVQFGKVTHLNHKNLKAILDLVPSAAADRKEIAIAVLRRQQQPSVGPDMEHSAEAVVRKRMVVKILPRPWSGRGLLGCHIKGYSGGDSEELS